MRKIKHRPIALALVILALFLSGPRSQTATTAPTTATNEDRIALYQALLDLQSPWTVMCIAAHPDDEDGTSLTVLRHKYGVHTVSVFSTYGEGGQNAIGPELYEELGAIRVRETMAAAEIQGSEPHFLGLKDFGFSKSADEAFKVWGHDEALRRMVLQIRTLRPDVIITNHDTTSGHGHHQATGRLELEAFDIAADPNRFPEQLKAGVTTWQVQRLFVRTGFGGGANAGPQPDQRGLVTIDPNEQDPVRGTTYAEQALAALQKHATQGPWPKSIADMARFRNSADGKLPLIRYRLTREVKDAAPLPPESHNVLDGLRLPEKIATELTPPTIDNRPLTDFANEPERVLNVLLKAGKNSSSNADPTDDAFRVSRFRELTSKALADAAGLKIAISPVNPTLARDSKGSFLVTISNTGTLTPLVMLTNSDMNASGTSDHRPHQIEPGKTDLIRLAYRVGTNDPITVPHSEHLYDGQLFRDFATMHVSMRLSGAEVSLAVRTWFDVAPSVEIADITPSPLVVRPATVGVSSAGADVFPPPSPKFKVQLINHLDQPFSGEIVIGQQNRNGETNHAVQLFPHQSTTLALSIPSPTAKTTAAHSRTPATADSVWFSVRRAGSRENITTRPVPVIWANARVARHLSVGYIRGFDYSLPNALSSLGVDSKELSVDEVKTADLQKYSTIIVDNRVYESQPELIATNQRLLDFASNGGTLIVFYHKSNEWNPDPRRNRPQLAPYPLTLSDARITDEDAPVTLTEADHPLLNFPNKIGPEDFGGWIQERGLYYPREWDSHYHALLSANDPGEKPLTGGLLVADYGRGHYIYTSMVWYRQLRAGVPGGYRMFANMISYGHQ
jgi:LmbE family N-acetylglucosaminyl deacetylase